MQHRRPSLRRWTKPPLIKRAWLRWALGVGAVIYLALAFGTTEVNWAARLGRPAARRAVLRGILPAGFHQPLERDRRRHPRKPLDDGGLHRDRHRACRSRSASALPRTSRRRRSIISAAASSRCRAASRRSSWRSSSSSCSASARSPASSRCRSPPSASTASCSPKTSRTWTPAQAEAVRATGAGWLQWINYGVQPQVMPRMIGLGLYRFDINFRESAVVGIVGGGGIGATLEHRVRPLRIRFRRRHPAGHHRHRDGWWNIPPATFAAGCSDGGRAAARHQGVAPARARRAVRDLAAWLVGGGDLHRIAGS